jgi:hypothetical protein
LIIIGSIIVLARGFFAKILALKPAEWLLNDDKQLLKTKNISRWPYRKQSSKNQKNEVFGKD